MYIEIIFRFLTAFHFIWINDAIFRTKKKMICYVFVYKAFNTASAIFFDF